MRTNPSIQFVYFVLAGIISFVVLSDCKGQNTTRRSASVTSVIAQQASHRGTLTAVILKDNRKRVYRFGIRSRNGTLSIIDEDFVPEAGYHGPLFKMSWNKTDDKVLIVVDHDFGDANLKFLFDIKTFSWKSTDVEHFN